MAPKRVETLAWVLIYSGLLLAALGGFVGQQGSEVGHVMLVLGLVDAAAGVGLIWWRSRMREDDE